jgi:hypothetical protein
MAEDSESGTIRLAGRKKRVGIQQRMAIGGSYEAVNRLRKFALTGAIALAVVACVFLGLVWAGQGLQQASLVAAVLGGFATFVIALAAIWPLLAQPSKVPAPPEQQVPKWVVDRPEELSAVRKALLGRRIRTVGITTGLHGAGGFGKTTLAQMVCASRRVRRRYRGYVYWVTVGRDVRGAAAVARR